MRLRAITVLSLLACAGLAQAEVYKWVDDKGKTHYSDHEPAASLGGAPNAQIVDGIPMAVQQKIRDAAMQGIDVDHIKGSERNCQITGKAASRALLLAFIRQLNAAGIGDLKNELPPESGPTDAKGRVIAHGPERFDLHYLLDNDLLQSLKAPR
ncbi:MAG: DUF4124 domain-containing protein [Nevskiaceae bacterium]|nr:MAG: DUF4124 domain-containing protein [Nevskiaceae bacterium]